MPFRLSCAVSQPDQTWGICTSAADLEQTVVPVLLQPLLVPDFQVKVRFFGNLSCSLRQILRCDNRAWLIDDVAGLVDRIRDDTVPFNVMAVLLVVSLQGGKCDLKLAEICFFGLVTIKRVSAEYRSLDSLANKRRRFIRVHQDAYAVQPLV